MSCYRKCYRPASARDDVDDALCDVGDGVLDGELDDALTVASFGPRVVGDASERLRATSVLRPRMDGAAVDRGQLDAFALTLEQSGGVDGQDVVGSVAIGGRIAKSVQPLAREPENTRTLSVRYQAGSLMPTSVRRRTVSLIGLLSRMVAVP